MPSGNFYVTEVGRPRRRRPGGQDPKVPRGAAARLRHRHRGAHPRALRRAPPTARPGARGALPTLTPPRPAPPCPQRPSREQVRAARAATRRRGLTHRVRRGRLGLPETGQTQPHGDGGCSSPRLAGKCARRGAGTRASHPEGPRSRAPPRPPVSSRLGSAPCCNNPAARDSAPAPRLASAPSRRLPTPPPGAPPGRCPRADRAWVPGNACRPQPCWPGLERWDSRLPLRVRLWISAPTRVVYATSSVKWDPGLLEIKV